MAVLRPPSSPAPWPDGSSHPCARCGETTAGIAVGGLCVSCASTLETRASRVGRWVALGSTLLLGVYLALTLRSVPLPWRSAARTVGAAAVVVWYLLTYRIAKRVAREWFR